MRRRRSRRKKRRRRSGMRRRRIRRGGGGQALLAWGPQTSAGAKQQRSRKLSEGTSQTKQDQERGREIEIEENLALRQLMPT